MSKTVPILLVYLSLGANCATATPISEGFKLVFSEPGVEFYQRGLPIHQSEYVTVVRLDRGSIANIISTISDAPDGKLERKSLLDFWNLASQKKTENTKLKVLINGTFFSQKLDPTPIAFGLKVGGKVISYGYGLDEFPGLIKILGFDSQKAFIVSYNRPNDLDIETPNLMGGLDATANKSASKYLPRTFAGVKDEDSEGFNETVIFYSSPAARQIDASNVLDSFGAKEKVMLDGGSSTGLIVNGVTYIKANRSVPQTIAIYASRINQGN
jgi:hypothetical protein